jgi:YggT family protein
MSVFISMVHLLSSLITWGVIIHVVLGYFLSPYHPAREFTSRIFEPMLAPIRRLLPQTGMLDFSPLVLIILVQLLEWLIISVL